LASSSVPLGGAIFGHYGDKLGRKIILVLTLLLMGLATFLIGVLPTFQSVGVLAPILLVVLRALQGVAVGGEWGGSYWPVALYVLAAALISFVSVYLATESLREDLTEELARDPAAQTGGAGQTT